MPQASRKLPSLPSQAAPVPGINQPPPIEVYGMGTVAKIRDELYYLENCMEGVRHSNHRVEESVDKLADELGSFVGVLEEIRDMLKEANAGVLDDIRALLKRAEERDENANGK